MCSTSVVFCLGKYRHTCWPARAVLCLQTQINVYICFIVQQKFMLFVPVLAGREICNYGYQACKHHCVYINTGHTSSFFSSSSSTCREMGPTVSMISTHTASIKYFRCQVQCTYLEEPLVVINHCVNAGTLVLCVGKGDLWVNMYVCVCV